MAEPTATNPQTGETVVFRNGAWVPSGAAPAAPLEAMPPAFIPGALSPTKAAAEQRAVEDQQFQREKFQLEQERADRAEVKANAGTVDEKKIATLVTRIAGGFSDIQGVRTSDPSSQEPGLIESVRGGLEPEGILGIPARAIAGPNRRAVFDAQRDVLDALLTLGTGAAYNAEQLSGQMVSYFPQYNDSPQEVAMKNQRLERLIAAAKVNAGPAWANVEPVVAQYMQGAAPQEIGGEENLPGSQSGDLQVTITDDSPRPPSPEAERLFKLGQEKFGDNPAGGDGLFTLAKQGITGGLSDEASGVGGAIGGLLAGNLNLAQNYRNNRDAERLNIEAAREFHPNAGLPAELIGAFASGGAGLSRAPLTVGQGATIGGVGGFGYGEGFQGSTSNALLSAGGGAALVRGGQMVGNALARRGASASDMGARVSSLARAGEAEGVSVNRAMADPSLANKVSRADASIAGGRKIQGEMSRIEGQIESRVGGLGRGGQPMDNIALGDRVKGAGERFIEKSGKAAKAKYDRAEQIAGNAKIAPKESLSRTDAMIAELSETPGTNEAEIAYLKKIKGDLGKELSVGALRRMRTALRQKISKGDLTFGESEARVLSIMDGAADDIRAGLTAAGKGKAARAFDVADKAYRARMDYINGTVQKLLGKRNTNISAEQIAGKFSSMASNDARGLRKFYATLEPDEAADVAATFAERIGKNNKGEFSVAHFLSQTEKMSDEAIRTVFGNEGATSVKNLRAVGAEVNRVTSSMNSRTSKSGVAAGNYRDWLFSLMLGGGSAGAGGLVSSGTGALAAGASVVATKVGKDALSARALMSPNLSKWLRNAPNTASPRAIDNHFARLTEIAKAEPALANEIDVLRNAIMQAANDNPAVVRSVAKDEDAGKR